MAGSLLTVGLLLEFSSSVVFLPAKLHISTVFISYSFIMFCKQSRQRIVRFKDILVSFNPSCYFYDFIQALSALTV